MRSNGPHTLLGPFALGELIGMGGMAQVWRATHISQDFDVAIKIVTAQQASNPRYIQAFKNEVRAVARLNHEHIIHVIDYGQMPSREELSPAHRALAHSPYLVMDLASAQTLADHCPCRDWQTLRATLLRILDALAHAHARGVIHRDLKPQNILLMHQQDPLSLRLSDFGIAQPMFTRRDSSLRDKRLQGTPYYMSPEQIEGRWRDQGPWTDLYALGCIAYKLTSGDAPFSGNLQQVLDAHQHNPLPELKPRFDVPQGFEHWLQCATAKEPNARYRYAAEAALALRQLSSKHWLIGTPHKKENISGEFISASRHTLADSHSESDTIELTPSKLTPIARGEQHSEIALAPIPPKWSQTQRAISQPMPRSAGMGLYGLRPTPFVGRAAEREQLWAHLLESQTTKRPRLALIQGLSGTGKTRLANWVCQRAHELGAAISIRINHSPQRTPSAGLGFALAKLYNTIGLDESHIWQRLNYWLPQHPGAPEEPASSIRALSRTLSQYGAEHDEQPQWITWANERDQRETLVWCIVTIAKYRPVILHCDDLQWGSDTLEIIHMLLQSSAPMTLLIAATIREDSLHDTPLFMERLKVLHEHPSALTIKLGPLPPRDHQQLINQIIGLDDELSQNICARTQGNPLFAVHLIGDLIDRGLLQAGPRGFKPTQETTLDLPDDLYHVWSARISQLISTLPERAQADAQYTLELCAALGREFPYKDIIQLTRQQEMAEPGPLLEEMISHGLIRREGPSMRLTHELLRESLQRSSQEAGRWITCHIQCAFMLRTIYNQWDPHFDERLAHHILQAQDDQQAIELILNAIRAQYERGDIRSTEALIIQYEQVIERLKLPEHSPHHGWLLLFHSIVSFELGRHESAQRYDQELVTRARLHGWDELLGHALMHQTYAAYDQGQLEHMNTLLQESLLAAQRSQDLNLQLKALARLAQLDMTRGQGSRAIAPLKIILQLCQDEDEHQIPNIMAHINLGYIYLSNAQYPSAREHLNVALGFCQKLHIQRYLAKSLECLGELERALGNFELAISFYQRALVIFEEADSSRAIAPVHINLAMCYLNLGDIPRAQQHTSTAAIISESQQLQYLTPFIQLALAICHSASGQGRRALTALELAQKSLSHAPHFPRDIISLIELLLSTAQAHDLPQVVSKAHALQLSFVQEKS